MATIKDMPNEIMHNIFSHLCCKDLTAASLVSHRFHSISLPSLYEQPDLMLHNKSPRPALLLLFLRTLLVAPRRETLAGYVRSLGVELSFGAQPTAHNAGLALVTVAASNLGFNDHPLTAQGNQIVLLLRLLPRLNDLSLLLPDVGRGTSYEYIQDALHCPTTLPIGLQNLHEFRSQCYSWCAGVTREILVGLLNLPSIRIITVSVVDHDAETEQFLAAATDAASKSLVTELNLCGSYSLLMSFKVILTIPKALARFSYFSSSCPAYFNLIAFGKALVPLQPSLEFLCIQFLDSERLSTDQQKPNDTIGTLRGWNTLHTLKIALMALLGRVVEGSLCLADLLPRGLRSLVIFGDCYWPVNDLVDQVVTVLERGEMVALRELTVAVFSWMVVPPAMEERLRRACEDAHVVFVLDPEGMM